MVGALKGAPFFFRDEHPGLRRSMKKAKMRTGTTKRGGFPVKSAGREAPDLAEIRRTSPPLWETAR